MVVGIIIGASIFVQPSEINRHVPSVPGVLSVWVVAGVLTLFGALVCAELSAAYPRTGGVYVFLKETLSPACGFLWGWAMFWSAHSGIIAASSVIFARYVAFFVPLGDAGIRGVAIAGILVLSGRQLSRSAAGQPCCKPSSPSPKCRHRRLLLVMVAFWAQAARRRPAVERPRAVLPRVRSRRQRGAVRLRRLAHGHLHRGRDARSARAPFRRRC